MSILIFFLVLFVIVLVHEWGHFITAKKTGMRVDEFGFGFPPKLFGVKKGETEYTFNALPLGGFVKILGENGDEDISKLSAEDKKRTFSSRPKWAQAIVLVAGVFMNVVLAWVLFTASYMIGVDVPVDEAEAGPAAKLVIAGTLPDSPAKEVPPGAEVVSIKGADGVIEHPKLTQFREVVSTTAPHPVVVTYKLGDKTKTVEITPRSGLDETNPERYLIGVSLLMTQVERESFLAAVKDGFVTTWYGLKNITTGLWKLVRDAFVGEADFSQVAGPVGIVGMVGTAAHQGLTNLLTFTAVISLNLAVINLLPFPALDGGRLLFVAIEAVTRRRIPPEWASRINLLGFALLMLLMIAVTYNDIIKLL